MMSKLYCFYKLRIAISATAYVAVPVADLEI